jgi:putative iron-regulated protein
MGRALFVGFALAACTACRDTSRSPVTDAVIHRALVTYADIAEASYGDATTGARGLVGAVDALLAGPSAATLEAAREAWLAAREPYAQTEVFRFYDGPIDGVEGLVNAWPIDESYIEAEESGSPGILENVERFPEITPELIVSMNAREGETSIASGFHAIEFLLWGRDAQRDGPGARPYVDYDTMAEGAGAQLAARRGRYLKLAAVLLVSHLERVTEAWHDRSDSYRSSFLGAPPRESLALALKGMGTLSGPELAGERLTVAYETKHQENEHSCFSDSTHLDLAGNVQGILNVCKGHYRRLAGSEIAGTGLCELVGRHDETLGKALKAQIASSLEAVRAIPAPFDRAILGNDEAPSRKAIAHAIAALQLQTESLTQTASGMRLMASAREAAR